MRPSFMKAEKMDCNHCDPAYCEYAYHIEGQDLWCELKGKKVTQKVRYYLSGNEVTKDAYDKWWRIAEQKWK